MPDVPAIILQGFEDFFDAKFYGRLESAANKSAKRVYVNNTFIDLRSAANQAGNAPVHDNNDWANVNGWTGFIIANNIHHAPNRTAPITTYAPLTAAGTFVARYSGERWLSATPDPVTDSSGTAFTGKYQPQTGSSALDAATGQVALDDFTGALRGGSPSIGAFQNAA